MKFFHLSDLHIGKQLNGYSLRRNQEEVFHQIIEAANLHHPDAILICGDIYDKSIPSAEAITVFDHFLEGITEITPKIPVFIIAGNHDSPERLNYASSFLEKHQIYLSVMPPLDPREHLKKVTLMDAYGPVHFYFLPFLKPGYVRTLFEEGTPQTYEEAIEKVLGRENINSAERNVLLSHQFYRAGSSIPQTCDSEQVTFQVGGLDQIDIRVLEKFDYAALGHLHGPQRVGRESIRYCGSPYTYSISEEHHKKSVSVITLGEKGKNPSIEMIPLKGIQQVRKERGTLEEILKKGTGKDRHDFVSITITDEEEPFHLREKIEEVYDHLLELKIDNSRTRANLEEREDEIQVLHPFEAFYQFYETVQHCPMSEKEQEIMKKVIAKAGEEEEG